MGLAYITLLNWGPFKMDKNPNEIDKARKGRNNAIAWGITALMALFFFITIVKFAGS